MSRVTAADLAPEHREVFSRAISAVLNTEDAELTYAQILDGAPLSQIFCNARSRYLHTDHPLWSHTDLCPGALDRAREYCKVFNPNTVDFDSKVRDTPATAPGRHLSPRAVTHIKIFLV